MNIIIAIAAFFGGLFVPAAAKTKIIDGLKWVVVKIKGLFNKKN